MKDELLTNNELAQLTGLAYGEIARIMNGERPVAKRQALILEITGYDAATWLYPQVRKYGGNPYMKLAAKRAKHRKAKKK